MPSKSKEELAEEILENEFGERWHRYTYADHELLSAFKLGYAAGLESEEVKILKDALEKIGCLGFRAKRSECPCRRCTALQAFTKSGE